MSFTGLMKRKWILVGLSLQLAALSYLPFIPKMEAAGFDAGGFIIEADRVVGENMKATIVSGETSETKAMPLLRITYDSAKIYGMRLTKQFRTKGGMVSITMKANGPVQINGMQVDTSAVSFKGACVHAEKALPSVALEGVTMVAHSMNAADSTLDQLQMQTVNGDGGVKKPGPLKVLQDLSALPFEQMKKEIEKITSGQLPLTCEPPVEEEDTANPLDKPVEDVAGKGADPVGGVIDPATEMAEKVTEPVGGAIGKVTDPVKDTADGVTAPVKEAIEKTKDPVIDEVNKRTEPVRETVRKTTGTAKTVTEPVQKTIRKTAETAKTVTDPVVEPVRKTVDQTAKTTCEKAAAANGKITKELGLELIDLAMKEKKGLDEVCPTDTTLTKQLEKWTESLLDAIGLLSLLGAKPSEEDQLEKMREALLKEPDGAIIDLK